LRAKHWWSENWKDGLAIASIVLFFVAFFPQALFGGRYLLAGDSFFYSYPMHVVAWQMIRHGQLPLWSPYTLSGYPLLAMTQLGLGYPLTWGHSFLRGEVAEQIYVLAPFLLAPIFTYLYLRTLGRSPLASLLAGLSFGYGGMMASPLGNSGMMTNAALWLPLFLLAIERVRNRSFLPSLLLATGAYTMSVLNGFGQGFVYVGLLALAYSLFLFLTDASPTPADSLSSSRVRSISRWKPVLVASGAGILAAGVAAFQILETARVVRRSIRDKLSFESFAQGSFTPATVWESFVMPLFYVVDMHAYVPPLIVGLALVAVWRHTRAKEGRDPRVFFFLLIALLALLLMMGDHTPLYYLLYHLPAINMFRVPSRHTFEWTFAISILGAYGWDEVAQALSKRRTAANSVPKIILALLFLAGGIVVGGLWWSKIQLFSAGPAAENAYRMLKFGFVLLTLVAILIASLVASSRVRFALLLPTLLVLCFVEPSAIVMRWWGHGFAATRFTVVPEIRQYLQQFPPEQGRFYTRTDLMLEQFDNPPRFDTPNFSAISGLHNVAGYEPLMLSRYSRALGNVGLDSVHSSTGGPPDPTLLQSNSHVLDILNTRFVISYANMNTDLASVGDPRQERNTLPVRLLPGGTMAFTAKPLQADTIELVTTLANSGSEAEGQAVARLRIVTASGTTIERELLAGRDTAEWAHERPDVRPFIKHKLAPIFDAVNISEQGGYPAYRYKTSIGLGELTAVQSVVVENISSVAHLAIHSAALENSMNHARTPLFNLYSGSWEKIYDNNARIILRNSRAQPRAWLVADAEAVDGEEAFARIRGESAHKFDPGRTALLEVNKGELPSLPGTDLMPGSAVRIVEYQPNRIVLESNAPTATVLVVSEIFYPGWKATIDGKPAQIYLTDFLLRGITLTPGPHRVEMRYTAPGARNGAIITLVTLCLIAGLGIVAWRRFREKAA
jgi:hypothetical protein